MLIRYNLTMRKKLSACILTYNSAEKLERLLKSLDFVDEVVVVDGGPTSGSNDNTLEIAKKYNCKIFEKNFGNAGEQRNFSTDKASHDWVLVLDSDEAISKDLAQEIENALKNDEFDGYELPRKTYFSGKPIMHSGWYPDYAVRLYNRKKMKFDNAEVHEKVVPHGKIDIFKNPIEHYSYSSVQDYWGRFKRYSAMQVKNKNVCQNHFNLLLMIIKPFYRFFKMYFLQLGILDGWRGLFLAFFSGLYDGRVHYLAEKEVCKKTGALYLISILALILAFFQGILIDKFGFLALALPLFLAILSMIFLNLRTALFVLILSILPGQLIRIYLSSGGGVLLSDLVVPMFTVAWLFYKAVKDPKLKKSPIDWSLGLFLVALVLTYIINLGRFADLVGLSYLVRLLFYLALFWPLYDLLADTGRRNFTEKVLNWLFYFLVGLGILQLIYVPYLLFLMKYGWDPHLNRMVSTFLDPNFLAAFLCIGFALALARFYTSKKFILAKIWPLLILGLAIILTYSRSGYIMFGIILFTFALFRDRKLLVIGLVAILAVTVAIPRVKQRIIGGANVDITASYRIGSWTGGWNLIEHNFYWGAGYNNLIPARLEIGYLEKDKLGSHGDSGNDSSLIVIWATTGLLGFLIFLYWYFQNIFLGFRAYFKKKEQSVKNLGLAMATIFLGLLANSFFNNTILYGHIIILLMLCLAIFYNYDKEQHV